MSNEIVKRDMTMMEIGSACVQSGYFKNVKQATQAIVKIQAGRELGFPPVVSMTGIYFFEDKITLSANLMAACVKRHPRYDYKVRKLDDTTCEIEFFEIDKATHQKTSAGVSAFSVHDAANANLLKKDNWVKYLRNMLFARALSNGIKWYCADATNCPIYTPDEFGLSVNEAGEVIDAEIVEPPAMPAQPPAMPPQRNLTQPPPDSLLGNKLALVDLIRTARQCDKPAAIKIITDKTTELFGRPKIETQEELNAVQEALLPIGDGKELANGTNGG